MFAFGQMWHCALWLCIFNPSKKAILVQSFSNCTGVSLCVALWFCCSFPDCMVWPWGDFAGHRVLWRLWHCVNTPECSRLQIGKDSVFMEVLTHAGDQLMKCIWLAAPGFYTLLILTCFTPLMPDLRFCISLMCLLSYLLQVLSWVCSNH